MAAGAIALAAAIGLYEAAISDPRNLALLFFSAVLAVGIWGGLRPALFAALLAFSFCTLFSLSPQFTPHFEADDILALATFLVGAVVIGGLTGGLSDRAREATQRLRDLRALLKASRDLSRAVSPDDAALRLVDRLQDAGCPVALWLIMDVEQVQLAGCSPGAEACAAALHNQVESFLMAGDSDDLTSQRWLIRMEGTDRTLGAVAFWAPRKEEGIRVNRCWIDALLEFGAIAIDRARLISEVADTAIVAEKEGLRTALLSSLSHDLRSPLATIVASVTTLQENGNRFDAQTKRELLNAIYDEAMRLNRYVANLLDMTRLESGALQVQSALIDPDEAMASAIEQMSGRLKDWRVVRRFAADGRRILVDPVLLEQALINILENAVVHAPSGSAIFVSTEIEGDRLVLAIEDEGAGIAAADLERVFDKFFSGRGGHRQGAGVGLGLSVARGLVEAFGGCVRAGAGASGKGARIEIRLPSHPAFEGVE